MKEWPFQAFILLFFLYSVDLDTDRGDPHLNPELREVLHEHLSRARSHGTDDVIGFLGAMSPVVRDFLALQRMKQIFPDERQKQKERVSLSRETFLTLLFDV